MASIQSYIDVSGADIINFAKIRGRVPAARNRFVITDPQELELLETLSLRELKWDGSNVLEKTAQEKAQVRVTEQQAEDEQWLNDDWRAARDSVLIDWMNELRALHSLPALTAADLDAAFEAKLVAARTPSR